MLEALCMALGTLWNDPAEHVHLTTADRYQIGAGAPRHYGEVRNGDRCSWLACYPGSPSGRLLLEVGVAAGESCPFEPAGDPLVALNTGVTVEAGQSALPTPPYHHPVVPPEWEPYVATPSGEVLWLAVASSGGPPVAVGLQLGSVDLLVADAREPSALAADLALYRGIGAAGPQTILLVGGADLSDLARVAAEFKSGGFPLVDIGMLIVSQDGAALRMRAAQRAAFLDYSTGVHPVTAPASVPGDERAAIAALGCLGLQSGHRFAGRFVTFAFRANPSAPPLLWETCS